MNKLCTNCKHDPKTCKYQNHNNKCNGHQLVSIDVIIKERDRLQVLGENANELDKQINYFYYGQIN